MLDETLSEIMTSYGIFGDNENTGTLINKLANQR
jgi:hypothetical protein